MPDPRSETNGSYEPPTGVEQKLLERVYPVRKRVAELLEAKPVAAAAVTAALRTLTEAATEALDVERASVWRLRSDGSAIDCLDLYCRTPARHETGHLIERDTAPAYFRAMATEKVIAAHDAVDDPRTANFKETYLTPLGITSMLDAPAFVHGSASAVVCHEHVGPRRRWQFWEELAASLFADMVALVLEAESRRDESLARERHEKELERLVAARSAALAESEQNLQALLDGAPIALVLTRAADHTLTYGNARAIALFEVADTDFIGMPAAKFWVREEDRLAFVSEVFAHGRVDDLEVELRTAKGRTFRARMNAQALRFRGEVCVLGGLVDITEAWQARKNFTEIFASAPVAMVLSRLSDEALVHGNARAEALFEISVDEARGRPAPDFWVQPEARAHLRRAVKEQGRVDGFEAELRTAKGRVFWAELSAAVVEFDSQPALLIGGNDVTARVQAQESLRRRESTVRTLLAAAPYPLVVAAARSREVRYCNEPFAKMFELTIGECIGRTASTFFVNAEELEELTGQLQRTGHVEGFTTLLRTASARGVWALMNARAMEFEGESAIMIGLADLTAQKRMEERLRTLATIDSLTGAFNRRHFFELAEAELGRAARHGHHTTFAMLDIDHFKSINDELGHAAGDTALLSLVETLREQVRGEDAIGRVGGEEFALVLPETALDAAVEVAERVREAIAARAFAEPPHEARRFTVSIGVAAARAEEHVPDVLKRADAALYAAKAAGRNRVVAAE